MSTENIQEWHNDAKIAVRLGWAWGYDTETIVPDDSPDSDGHFEPFESFDFYIESPDGERQYLYSNQDRSKPAPESSWTWQRTGVLPRYSGNETDAGLVLDRIAAQGWAVTVYTGPCPDRGIVHRCCIMRQPGDAVLDGVVDVIAETRPLAICQAFVEACERWGNESKN